MLKQGEKLSLSSVMSIGFINTLQNDQRNASGNAARINQ